MDCNKVNIIPGINESTEGSEIIGDNGMRGFSQPSTEWSNKVFENYVADEIDKLDMSCYRGNYNNYWDGGFWKGETLDSYAPVYEDDCKRQGKYDIDDEYRKYMESEDRSRTLIEPSSKAKTLEYRCNSENNVGYPQGIFRSGDIYVNPDINQEYKEYDKYDNNIVGKIKNVFAESNIVGEVRDRINNINNGNGAMNAGSETRENIIDRIRNIATPYLTEARNIATPYITGARNQLQNLGNMQPPIISQNNNANTSSMVVGFCIVMVIIILLVVIFWMIFNKK